MSRFKALISCRLSRAVYLFGAVVVGLHLKRSLCEPTGLPGPSGKFRLIQSTHNSSNHIRQSELETVLMVNRRMFDDMIVTTERRFSALFRFASPSKVNIIANGDIMFDESIHKSMSIDKRSMYALSRHEMGGQIGGADSQDVWIFRGKINDALRKSNISFSLGHPGCDNRIAWEAKQAGYTVSNPSLSIKVWHYHCSLVRTYTQADTVPPPYHLINPSSL